MDNSRKWRHELIPDSNSVLKMPIVCTWHKFSCSSVWYIWPFPRWFTSAHFLSLEAVSKICSDFWWLFFGNDTTSSSSEQAATETCMVSGSEVSLSVSLRVHYLKTMFVTKPDKILTLKSSVWIEVELEVEMMEFWTLTGRGILHAKTEKDLFVS